MRLTNYLSRMLWCTPWNSSAIVAPKFCMQYHRAVSTQKGQFGVILSKYLAPFPLSVRIKANLKPDNPKHHLKQFHPSKQYYTKATECMGRAVAATSCSIHIIWVHLFQTRILNLPLLVSLQRGVECITCSL